MSDPVPDTRSARQLVRASDDVIGGIAQQVQPPPSLPNPDRNPITTAAWAFLFTWPPTLVVLVAATVAVPSETNDAGVGTAAIWALDIALLIAIAASISTIWQHDPKPGPDGTPQPIQRVLLRVAAQALLTGACAWLVLALHGLTTGQIALLVVALIVVLNLLPVIAARLLHWGRGRSGTPPTRA
ncbi:hypothetical protein V6U77_12615 [Micromonospora sp. CPCC 205546]|uniref:hypothetical protein n=1 Tax=Micromonospora sp. CPCC 205546 TaxID=3122397 RepID=UPI002FF379F2